MSKNTEVPEVKLTLDEVWLLLEVLDPDVTGHIPQPDKRQKSAVQRKLRKMAGALLTAAQERDRRKKEREQNITQPTEKHDDASSADGAK